MTLAEIRKQVALNLGMLADDNETILDGNVTKAGLDDNINRIYLNVLCQQLMNKSMDDFTVEARTATNRANFVVASVDTVNKTITSTTPIFGSADTGARIYNVTDNSYYTIVSVSGASTITISETPSATWVGDTVYIMSNIIILEGEMSDFKEILKVQVKYNTTDTRLRDLRRETVNNFKDIVNNNNNSTLTGEAVYAVSQIKVNDVMKRCLYYYPYPTNYNGEVRISYTQLPATMMNDTDTPLLENLGVSEVLINATTAWGFKILGDLNKASLYEENNPNFGGIVPKGLTSLITQYKPFRGSIITYKGFR